MPFETINGILTAYGNDSSGSGATAAIGIKDEGSLLPNSPYSIVNIKGDGLRATHQTSEEVAFELDLSAVIREEFSIEDALESSTNAIVYQRKLRLQFIPLKSVKFIIIAYIETSMDINNEQGKVRLIHDSGNILSEVSTLLPSPSDPHSSDEWQDKTLSSEIIGAIGVQQTIDIDWKTLDSLNTVYLRRAKILALGI